MRLSNNFKLEEFERSNTAGQLGIDNTAPREAIDNLSRLCTLLLQPLRDYYKTKIFINSGYRSPDLNARIGGAPKSQHLRGQAADIHFTGMDTLPDVLKKYGVSFDQLIIYPTFVHLSYVSVKENRKQIIKHE